MLAKHICLCLHIWNNWLHWSATWCSATLTKQMFWSELKAPSISQIDCKWHLTKWLIRAVVSSLRCRHYPIRQTLTGQVETKLEEKDQELSPPRCLMRWTNIQSWPVDFSFQIYVLTWMQKMPWSLISIHTLILHRLCSIKLSC